MIIKYETRADAIRDAEKDLQKFKRGIESGFWAGMGYTEGEMQNTLEELTKAVSYLKGECSFTEYHIAYAKARRGRGDC